VNGERCPLPEIFLNGSGRLASSRVPTAACGLAAETGCAIGISIDEHQLSSLRREPYAGSKIIPASCCSTGLPAHDSRQDAESCSACLPAYDSEQDFEQRTCCVPPGETIVMQQKPASVFAPPVYRPAPAKEVLQAKLNPGLDRPAVAGHVVQLMKGGAYFTKAKGRLGEIQQEETARSRGHASRSKPQ
jgi:hypothetical protein